MSPGQLINHKLRSVLTAILRALTAACARGMLRPSRWPGRGRCSHPRINGRRRLWSLGSGAGGEYVFTSSLTRHKATYAASVPDWGLFLLYRSASLRQRSVAEAATLRSRHRNRCAPSPSTRNQTSIFDCYMTQFRDSGCSPRSDIGLGRKDWTPC
ncbi:hypothetical protein BV20DRAFT_968881 [Pilatotrama ljubarskyi]|nr:hypothetical protein BV20DRAFT_968881 [Pilatotrama ljubarskyi]